MRYDLIRPRPLKAGPAVEKFLSISSMVEENKATLVKSQLLPSIRSGHSGARPARLPQPALVLGSEFVKGQQPQSSGDRENAQSPVSSFRMVRERRPTIRLENPAEKMTTVVENKLKSFSKADQVNKDYEYGGPDEINEMLKKDPPSLPKTLGIDRAQSKLESRKMREQLKQGPVLDEHTSNAKLTTVR